MFIRTMSIALWKFPRSYPIGAIHVWKIIVLFARLGAVPPPPITGDSSVVPLPSQG